MPTPAELYDRHILHTAQRTLTLVRGEGTRVFDDRGNGYLDFATGIAVSCLGHNHPALVEVFATQPKKLIHCSNLYYNENAGPVAAALTGLFGAGRVFFSNSGAEANEGLIKLARLHGGKEGRGAFEIICAKNSFHGRTMGTISATGQEKVQHGFAPLLPGFVHVPYNDLEAVRAALTPQTAAVLIEGIQGEGGVLAATPEYLLGLRALTKEKNLLLLIDGVQCGHFRTGHFQSWQRILEGHPAAASFRPDAVSTAKSLGGGFPIGAFWIDAAHADLFTYGSHNTTYGGSPLGTAVIGAILDTIEKDRLAENIRQRGDQLLTGLRGLAQKYPAIAAVRGYGGLIGLELAAEPAAAQPHFTAAGLLLAAAGNRTLRYLPAYTATPADVNEALERTEQALRKLAV
jgi:acetylornithine/N-succinyldiaminopimelate aminotransferase